MPRRAGLFRKYSTLIVSLVGGALLVSGGINLLFSYQQTRNALLLLEREKAQAAAAGIGRFVGEIERQLGWTTFPQAGTRSDAIETRRLDLVKLLRQVPAVTDASYIDGDGREQVRLSRLELDVVGSATDLSADPRFTMATRGGSYFGPVYFRKGSEPYMSIAARAGRGGGVTAVEVNLKFVWDVITRVRIGKTGLAYVVDGKGTLISHPDISLVLGRAEMSTLPQVRQVLAAAAEPAGYVEGEARDHAGRKVLAAYARIEPLTWIVFVEQSRDEAMAPARLSMFRSALLLAAGLALAVLASLLLARRMTRPIAALREGAVAIGAGRLDHRIDLATDDELQEVGEQFNRMGDELRASYSQLEAKVAERTAALAREQERTRELLHNILPREVAEELSRTGKVLPVRHESVTILFSDFSGFTQAASAMPADRMVAELNEIFAAFDEITDRCGVEKIKTIGDAYMAAAGLPLACPDHAQRCVRAGLEMVDFLERRNHASAFKWLVRIGVHSGPVVAGIVGSRKYAYDIWGDTVNIASRMESSGEVGRVNVSAYTCDLVRDAFACEYRGKVAAKGKGEIDMYFVVGPR